ncbi:MAG: carboxypeptidase regulatory-like domain-containing protein [Niastella sp.]|nr:carboxypeptidase regulatory-like domain-containing protein [Niastella sp.]
MQSHYHFKNYLKFLFPVIIILFILSCQKNLSGTDPVTAPVLPDFTSQVTISAASGFVTNENNLPVQGAIVKLGAATTSTNQFGYFEFGATQVTKMAAVVTVTMPGYFNAIKTFMAETGKQAFFRMKLLPKTIAGSIDAASGGTVNTTTGLSIQIPAGGVVNAATQATYNGMLQVAAYWIDPSSRELNSEMPGDLRAINTDNKMQLLTTYGMAAVELTGAAGEKLQIASGKKATLHFPLSPSLSASSPASIKLWHFDETKGLWIEEGSAMKTGNEYVGEVSHFSFWNCDVPANYIHLSMTIKNTSGEAVPHAWVKISVVSNPQMSSYGYTDSSGYVSGAVFANSQLKIEVFSNHNCGQPVYTQIITTGTTDLSLGDIIISPSPTLMANVEGTVTDCNNTAVVNGRMFIHTPSGFNIIPITNGHYIWHYLLCDGPENVIFIAEDITGGAQSLPITVNIHAGGNNMATMQACGVSTQQYWNMNINGTTYNLTAPADTLAEHVAYNGTNNADIGITGHSIANNYEVNLVFVKANIALNSMQNLVKFLPPTTIGEQLTPVGLINVNITELGAIGSFIAGNFTGTFTGNTTSTTYTVNSNFRVRRTY